MAYNYDRYAPGLVGPFHDEVPLAHSDTADLADPPRALLVEAAGTLRYTTLGGTVRNVTLAAGDQVNVMVRRIHVTGTTIPAGSVFGLY